MLNPGYTTVSKFLIQNVPEGPHGRELAALLVDVAAVIKAISAAVGKGPLTGMSGLAGSENTQGESQKKLDVVSDELFVRGIEWSGLVGALASEEMEDVHFVEGSGRLALVFDPLDGSSNIDVNVAVGSIFSVLALPEGASDRSRSAAARREAACGGLCDLRALDAARAHRRHGDARVHARSGDRQFHPHAPGHTHPRGDLGVLHQRVEPPLLGAAGAALRRRMQGRQGRSARPRLQYALGRIPRRRHPPGPDARRDLSLSRATRRNPIGTDACA